MISSIPYTTTTICAAGGIGNTPVVIAGGGLGGANNITETIVMGSGGTGAYGTSNRRGTRGVYDLTTGTLNVGDRRVVITSANIVKRILPVRPVRTKVGPLISKLSCANGRTTTATVVAASAVGGRCTIRFRVNNIGYGVNNVTGNSKVVRPGVTAALGFVAASTTVRGDTLRRTLGSVIGVACGYLSVSNSASAGSVITLVTGKLTRGRRVGDNSIRFILFGSTLCRIVVRLAEVLTGSNRNTSGLVRYIYGKTPDRSSTVAITGSIVNSALFGYTVFNRSTG